MLHALFHLSVFVGGGASFDSAFSAAAAGVCTVIFLFASLRPLSVLTVSAPGGGGGGGCGAGGMGATTYFPGGVLDLALPLALAFALDFAFADGLAGGTSCSGGATTAA